MPAHPDPVPAVGGLRTFPVVLAGVAGAPGRPQVPGVAW
jgi:hypothetical protein